MKHNPVPFGSVAPVLPVVPVVPVVLMGPPASGKSALGRALAEALGRSFADVDERVAAEAGQSVAHIFATEGEAGFRARERRVFTSLLAEGVGVIAAGGGTLLDDGLRRRTLREAVVLSLEAPRQTLVERARSAGGARPLLAGDVEERLAALLQARAAVYAECHARVATGGSLEEAVKAARAALDDVGRSRALVMPLGERSYRIHQEPLARLAERVKALGASQALVVTDARVWAALADRRPRLGVTSGSHEVERVVLAGRGDADKTLSSLERIWDAALAAGLDRQSMLVGVGGGVVTDVTGFAAATLLRGVRFASAPTTLLSMVDASVGGKTGIDHPRGKNLIGAFHQPSVVVCDVEVLPTLPVREVRAGLAEVAKIALCRDARLLDRLAADRERLARCDLEAIGDVVGPAIQAKIDVVAADEREGGLRELLNFGHTIGHAIEQASDWSLPHGECVALGMRAALDLGRELGVTPAEVADEAMALLDALALPSRPALPADVPLDLARCEAALESDKKKRGGELRFVLLEGRGASRVVPVPRSQVLRALTRLVDGRLQDGNG